MLTKSIRKERTKNKAVMLINCFSPKVKQTIPNTPNAKLYAGNLLKEKRRDQTTFFFSFFFLFLTQLKREDPKQHEEHKAVLPFQNNQVIQE